MKKIFRHRFFKAVGGWFIKHKIISIFILAAILFGGYKGYAMFTDTSKQTRYVTSVVQKGSVIVSISGTGQVSASNQLEMKPKVSGDITGVYVSAGQTVKKGTLLISIDSRTAQKSVRDAQASLETARISFEKLKEPADVLSLTQSENALASAEQAKQDAENNLIKAYDDGFNGISNAFLSLPEVMTGLDGVLNGSVPSSPGQSYIDWYYEMIQSKSTQAYEFRATAVSSYLKARVAYDATFERYRSISHYSDTATKEALITESYDTTKLISEALKNTKNFLDLTKDVLSNANRPIPSSLTTHQTNVESYTGSVNSSLANLLNVKNTIETSKDNIINTERTITEKTQSLAKLKAGADVLDIKSQEISLQQRQNALADAYEALADYSIRAPFDGTVAKVSVKKGDPSSGSASLVTLVTSQQIADITLNEVDVAKIKPGQKTTLTFDAIEGLSIAGEVLSVDGVGTATQGVVNYAVKISFDTQDERIKPGMSVSAAIVIDMKQDVIAIPTSAIKTQNGNSFVEIINGEIPTTNTGTQGFIPKEAPIMQAVTLGLQNDSQAEIISGLNGGENIVTRTITSASQTKTTNTTAPSLFGSSSGGGGNRIPGR